MWGGDDYLDNSNNGTLRAAANETPFQDKPVVYAEKRRKGQTQTYETSHFVLSLWWRTFSNCLSS